MESLDLTDDELRASLLQARKMLALAQNSEFVQVASHYRAVEWMLDVEGARRGLEL